MKKLLEGLNVLIFAYTIGLMFVILFLFLVCMGRIKIENPGNWLRLKKKMLGVFNHDDCLDCMSEIFWGPCLFFRQWLLRPLKWVPYFVLDGRNFTDKWYWRWLKVRAIPINRDRSGRRNSSVSEEREIERLLNRQDAVVFTWGSGRDCTCEGVLAEGKLTSKRPLGRSIGLLWGRTKATVLPIAIWNGGAAMHPGKPLFSFPNLGRGRIFIKFGDPIPFTEEIQRMTNHERARFIDEKLLGLTDELAKKYGTQTAV